jgi:DNA-binding transcriptional LysR family regulator
MKTLRLFVSVCEFQNISKAAEHESIEPSAISKRMLQLEEDLRTSLLVRARRGVTPTPAGLSLLEHARSILFTVDRIANDVADHNRGITGHVRLVATSSAIAESLMDDIAAFIRIPANANIKIDAEERVSRDVIREVRQGIASIGLCWNVADFEGLEHLPYRSDHLALAVQQSHPFAKRDSIRFEQTLGEEHVGLPTSTAVHAMLRRAAARSHKTLAYRVIVSNFDAALRVVGAGLGVSVVPIKVSELLAQALGIRMVPLADSWARRRFAICFQNLEGLQPPARRVVEHLVRSAELAETKA